MRGRLVATVLRRMEGLGVVTPAIEQLVRDLPELQPCRAGVNLDPDGRPMFLVQGWAARVRWLPDGRRQIINLVLPGESVGVGLRPNPLAPTSTVALTAVRTVDATAVHSAATGQNSQWADLREILHMSGNLDESYLLNQVVRLGRQTGYERTCHLLLEIRERLTGVGVGDGEVFPMSLTQEMLADTTGLSTVHINRTIQQLRRERLLWLQSGNARLLNLPALERIAGYVGRGP